MFKFSLCIWFLSVALINALATELRDLYQRGSQTVRARGDGRLLGSRVHQMRQHQCPHELRDCDSLPQTCAGSNQTKSHHWEREVHKQPHPEQKALSNRQVLGKNKISFSSVV